MASLTFFPIPSLNPKSSFPKSFKCLSTPNITIKPSSSSTTTTTATTSIKSPELTTYKLQHIVSEFHSLPKPIDRVKRLLHYASLLPDFDESLRTSSNRVTGCTVQVWVDVSMDDLGRMRFMADSDSEIMKGFCSCLLWLLDGAFPDEVLDLDMDDLSALNVGLNGRTPSRVNTWHNVLISMQRRTKLIINQLHVEGLA